MFASTLHVAWHELRSILGTRRIIVVAAGYCGSILIAGTIYLFFRSFAEEKLVETLISQGQEPELASENMRLMTRQGYEKLTMWLAGVESQDELSGVLRYSSVLSLFFWLSCKFFPMLIALTSFDQLAQILRTRSICVLALRVSRPAILVGKVLGHTALFAILTMVSSLLLLAMSGSLLASTDMGEAILGLLRVWACLLPLGLCYISLTAFASVSSAEPMPVLMTAFGLTLGTFFMGSFVHISEQSSWFWLRPLHYLSPAQYEMGFWRAGVLEPLGSGVAHLVFALFFLLLGMWRLRGRDL